LKIGICTRLIPIEGTEVDESLVDNEERLIRDLRPQRGHQVLLAGAFAENRTERCAGHEMRSERHEHHETDLRVAGLAVLARMHSEPTSVFVAVRNA
jgi:hypothetical protein